MRSLLAAATLLAVVPAADATWSIVLVDTRTGEIGIASATCLTNFDLQANSRGPKKVSNKKVVN